MKHFLDIESLSASDIDQLIQRSLFFKYNQSFPSYPQYTVANLFYENSTRTRVSFELAAKHLNMPVINLNLETSSEKKGEVISDTVQNLAAMGISHFVIRHSQEMLPHELSEMDAKLHIINAGDGKHAHPSQALLDFVTIYEQKPNFKDLKIAVLGNIRHSRVASSLQAMGKNLNVGQLVMIAPELWQPEKINYGSVSDNLKESLKDADVIICLRVQKERLKESEQMNLDSYIKNYSLTSDNLALAKPDAMVLHPGPVNRGVEIENAIVDGEQSFILQQVANGVFSRMAILEALID